MMRHWTAAAAGLAALASAAAAFAAQTPPQPPAQAGSAESVDEINNVNDAPRDVTSAVSSPVEDLNLKKTPIPEVLQRATANPYDMRGVGRCAGIAAELARLDAALGRDMDLPPEEEKRSIGEKGVGLVRTGVQVVTPYRGIIRRISGASSYEKKVQEAIEAGSARRGFLKGMGMKMNCAPPAAPAWFKPVVAKRPAPAPPRPRPPARR